MARARKPNPTALLDQHLRANELRFSTLLGVIQTLATLGFAWGAANLIGVVLKGDDLGPDLNLSVLLILSALLIKVLASYAQNLINLSASVHTRDRLRQEVLDRCFKLGIGLYPSFKPAELANMLTLEIDKLKDYYADYQIQRRMAFYTPILIILASCTVNWLVPLLLLLTTPLIPVFMMLVGKRAAEASRNNMEALNRLGHLLEDRLQNINLLQQENSVTNESKRLFEQSNQFRISTMKVLRLAFLSGTLLEFFAAISVALVAVYLGLFFLDKYSIGAWGLDISFAEGAFLLMLAPEYYLPLRRLGALYHAKSNARALAERLQHLEQLTNDTALSTNLAATQVSRITQLEISELSCGKAKSVHQPFSCVLSPGDSLLIEAPSGTGKTTLLDTLAGLRPALSGSVQVNGETCELYGSSEWQKQVGYISQHPELIYGSLRDNLSLGRSFSDAELWQALKQAQLDELVKQLPLQLEHFISDSGDFLSGGQVQRLSIARALLHKPALLLLDEPIANLDQETAERFMQSLKFHTQSGGMLIMASHRSTTQFSFTHQIELRKAAATPMERTDA